MTGSDVTVDVKEDAETGILEATSSKSEMARSSSKANLQNSMWRKRQSLTISEHSFLETLIVEGEDEEMERAADVLDDDDLFPVIVVEANEEMGLGDEEARQLSPRLKNLRLAIRDSGSEERSEGNRERSNLERRDSPNHNLNEESSRRDEYLQTRRSSGCHKMFAAHKMGLSFSPGQSTRNVIPNLKSGSFASLWSREREDIFRSNAGNRSFMSCHSIPQIAMANRLSSFSNPNSFSMLGHPPLPNARENSTPSFPGLSKAAPLRFDSTSIASSSWSMEDEVHEGVSELKQQPMNREGRKGLMLHPDQRGLSNPVFIRKASNVHILGEGFEVSDGDADRLMMDEARTVALLSLRSEHGLASFDDFSIVNHKGGRNMPSFIDDTELGIPMLKRRYSDHPPSMMNSSAFDRKKRMSLSGGFVKKALQKIQIPIPLKERFASKAIVPSDDSPVDDSAIDNNDSWDDLYESNTLTGYGGRNHFPFHILGTDSNDTDSSPHVLSPPLMESLQYFFPYEVSESNFWMKYSLVRDGASLFTMMQNIRGAKHSIIAIETVEGDVFGSFTSTQWKQQRGFFGNGEAFLWRMRHKRGARIDSILDRAKLESEVDIFPWTGKNYMVQSITSKGIGIGGSSPDGRDGGNSGGGGFGLFLDCDLLRGASDPCETFDNASLADHVDTPVKGNGLFHIANLEVWTLTPGTTVEAAEKIEMGKLFLEENTIKF